MREIPKNKRYALGWYNEGVTLLGIREYEEATTFFDNALKAIPDHPDFLIGKGDVLLATGNYSEAHHFYHKAIEQEPENFRAWMRAGVALLRMGKNEKALETFEKAKDIFEYDGELWLGYGIALLNVHRTAEATESLKKAMRLKPNQPALWYFLSTLEKNDEDAMKLLIRGNRMDPGNIDILLEMSKRLLHMELVDKSAETLKKAYEIDSENMYIRRAVEHFRKKTGKYPF
ncbi:MAG: tetratricopeptide repeat protein [Methanomicrobiaceae archaeon]|nr:tetratricopeptide repeat protein [Methanomicrobiaceae archaeon]